MTAPAPTLASPWTHLLAVVCSCVTVIAVSPRAVEAGPRIVGDEPPVAQEAPVEAVEAVDPVDDRVVRPEVSAGTREVYARPVYDPRGFELGFDGGIFYSGNDYIAQDALYGGTSIFMRWRLDSAWALTMDIGAAFRQSEDLRLMDNRVLFGMGANWYLLSGPVLELFSSFGVVMGGGTVTQELDHGANDVSEYGEIGLHVGFGADVRFGDWFLTLELRAPMLFRLDDHEYGPPPGRDYSRTAEDFRTGLQSKLGAGYRF